MNNNNISQGQALQMMVDIIGSWDHYYCPKCDRHHQVNKSSIPPRPSKIFIEHIVHSKNPNDNRRDWIGKKILEPSIPKLLVYYNITTSIDKIFGYYA